MRKNNTLTIKKVSAIMAAVMSISTIGSITASAEEYAPEQTFETSIVMEANADGEYEVVGNIAGIADISDISAIAGMGLTEIPEASVPLATIGAASTAAPSANSDTTTKYYQGQNGQIVVVTREKSTNKDAANFNATANATAKYYPGAIVTTRGIEGNDAGVVTDVDRNTCVMTVMQGTTGVSVEYDPSSHSNYVAALQTALAQMPEKTPTANFHANYTYATSEEDIKASLGLSSDIIENLNINFNAIKQGKCQTCIVSYVQEDFRVTVDTQTKTQPFADSDAAHALMDNRDADDQVAMINTAQYGRRVYVAYTTNDTSFNLQAELDATYKKIKGNAKFEYSEKLSNVSCNMCVSGGNTEEYNKLKKSDMTYSDIMTSLNDIGSKNDFANSEFISYTANSLADGRNVASNNTDSMYTTNISYKNTIPVEFSTASGSIGPWVHNFHVKLDYDMLVPANSDVAKNAQRTSPDSVTVESEDVVRIHVTDNSKITKSGLTNNIDIPAAVDINTLKIAVGYDGTNATSNHDNFVSVDFAKNIDTVEKIKIECDSNLKFLGMGYTTTGKISVNGKQVKMDTDE